MSKRFSITSLERIIIWVWDVYSFLGDSKTILDNASDREVAVDVKFKNVGSLLDDASCCFTEFTTCVRSIYSLVSVL